MTFNQLLRVLVSLAGAIAALVFLLLDQLLFAIFSLVGAYFLNGVLASMAFAHPEDFD